MSNSGQSFVTSETLKTDRKVFAGGRDKMWKLSGEAMQAGDIIKEQLKLVKQYWS